MAFNSPIFCHVGIKEAIKLMTLRIGNQLEMKDWERKNVRDALVGVIEDYILEDLEDCCVAWCEGVVPGAGASERLEQQRESRGREEIEA